MFSCSTWWNVLSTVVQDVQTNCWNIVVFCLAICAHNLLSVRAWKEMGFYEHFAQNIFVFTIFTVCHQIIHKTVVNCILLLAPEICYISSDRHKVKSKIRVLVRPALAVSVSAERWTLDPQFTILEFVCLLPCLSASLPPCLHLPLCLPASLPVSLPPYLPVSLSPCLLSSSPFLQPNWVSNITMSRRRCSIFVFVVWCGVGQRYAWQLQQDVQVDFPTWWNIWFWTVIAE